MTKKVWSDEEIEAWKEGHPVPLTASDRDVRTQQIWHCGLCTMIGCPEIYATPYYEENHG